MKLGSAELAVSNAGSDEAPSPDVIDGAASSTLNLFVRVP